MNERAGWRDDVVDLHRGGAGSVVFQIKLAAGDSGFGFDVLADSVNVERLFGDQPVDKAGSTVGTDDRQRACKESLLDGDIVNVHIIDIEHADLREEPAEHHEPMRGHENDVGKD